AIYTPVYDAASAALPQEERGRAIGICDLIVNISPSIGIAVYSDLIENAALGRGTLFGIEGMTACQTANVFWIMFLVALASLVLVLIFRKPIKSVVKKSVSVDTDEDIAQ
ncbi:MAG: hypothetical protein IIY17_01945, partial [Aeriscardovia sp.]|nr:hypothetical protein [Aeriscardovia sp.]